MGSNNSKPSLSPIAGLEDVEIERFYVIRRRLQYLPVRKDVVAHSALLLKLANGEYWEVGRAGYPSTKPQNYEVDTVFRKVPLAVLNTYETGSYEKISLGDGYTWTKQLRGEAPPRRKTLGETYNYSVSHCRQRDFTFTQDRCHEFQESVRIFLGGHVPPQTGQSWRPWFMKTNTQRYRPSWDDSFVPSRNAWKHGNFENRTGTEFSYGRTNRWAGVLFGTPGSPFDLAGESKDHSPFTSLLDDHLRNEFRWKPQFFLRETLAFETFVDARSNYSTSNLVRHATFSPSNRSAIDPVSSFFLYQDLPNLTVPLAEIQTAAAVQQSLERGLGRERRPYVRTACEIRDRRYDTFDRHFQHFQYHGPHAAEDLRSTYEYGSRTDDSSYLLKNLLGIAVWAGSAYLSGGNFTVRPSFRPDSTGFEARFGGIPMNDFR